MIAPNKSVEPGMNTILEALANKYRRRVLIALLEHNPQDDHDPQIPDDVSIETGDLESLMINIRHTHLPKLEEAGFIEWNQEGNTVRKGPQFEEIRPLLELMENNADELPDDWL
ncbi:ArsR family transcriptional regulator [Natrialbaceae archaeon A-CW3]